MKQSSGDFVRNFFLRLSAIVLTTGFSIGLMGQTPSWLAPRAIKPVAEVGNPVADPTATLTLGNARFTVLTPELIRMEWAADGNFEDHASFVFYQSPVAGAEVYQHRNQRWPCA